MSDLINTSLNALNAVVTEDNSRSLMFYTAIAIYPALLADADYKDEDERQLAELSYDLAATFLDVSKEKLL